MRFYWDKFKAASRPMHQSEVLDSVHYLIMTTYNKRFKLPYHEEPLLQRLTFTVTLQSCLCIFAKKIQRRAAAYDHNTHYEISSTDNMFGSYKQYSLRIRTKSSSMVRVSARLREDFSDYYRTCLSFRGVQNTAIEINV